MRRLAALLASTALCLPPAVAIDLGAPVHAQAQPCQWNYSAPPPGTSTATYCGNVTVAGTITGTIVGGTVNYASFNPVEDGVTDDSAALQACVNAAANGTCLIPSSNGKVSAIANTVTITNGALIAYAGQQPGLHNIAPTFGFSLKWTGTAGGTILQYAPPGTTVRNSGGGLTGILIDCNSDAAAIGVQVKSTSLANFQFGVQHCSAEGLDIVPVATMTIDPADPQFNSFSVWADQHNTGDGEMVKMEGTATANTSFDHFPLIYGLYKNAVGVELVNADNNDIDVAVGFQSVGGTATSFIQCDASASAGLMCRANHFHRVSGSFVTGNTINFQGIDSAAFASQQNSLDILDDANGATIRQGTGVTMQYGTDSQMFSVFGGHIFENGGILHVGFNCGAGPVFPFGGQAFAVCGNFNGGGAEADEFAAGNTSGTDCFRRYHLTGASSTVLLDDTFCNGHRETHGTAPAVVAGTGATIAGNDSVGRVTVGTTPGTTVALTFANAPAWTNNPICFAQDETAAASVAMHVTSITTSAVTFTATATLTAGDKVSYNCGGYQ